MIIKKKNIDKLVLFCIKYNRDIKLDNENELYPISNSLVKDNIHPCDVCYFDPDNCRRTKCIEQKIHYNNKINLNYYASKNV